MRLTNFILVCFIVIASASIMGCATVGRGQTSSTNWALAQNGGRVSAFSEDPEHPASALIDGVTSSANWDQGGGWQATISTSPVTRSVRAQREEQERNWIIIELSQPITVNEVKIHTIDSEKYPASKFAVSDLLVQYELQTASKDLLWANINRPGKGIGSQDNIIRGNIRPVIDVRFNPVTTQKIRVLIYSTNDLTKTEDNKAREGSIRLTEIEVYGSGKQKSKDKLDELFEK